MVRLTLFEVLFGVLWFGMMFTGLFCFAVGLRSEVVELREQVSVADVFTPPVAGGWKPDSYQFGQDCSYPMENGTLKRWGLHLGEDMNLKTGTEVLAIGNGKVMVAQVYPGSSKDKRNWGGVVILAHKLANGNVIYSLSGHLKVRKDLKKGDRVKRGDVLGHIAPALTAENGWWEDEHLHLQIIVDQTDVYRGGVLRGYAHEKAPNRLADCIAPSALFELLGPGRGKT